MLTLDKPHVLLDSEPQSETSEKLVSSRWNLISEILLLLHKDLLGSLPIILASEPRPNIAHASMISVRAKSNLMLIIKVKNNQ